MIKQQNAGPVNLPEDLASLLAAQLQAYQISGWRYKNEGWAGRIEIILMVGRHRFTRPVEEVLLETPGGWRQIAAGFARQVELLAEQMPI